MKGSQQRRRGHRDSERAGAASYGERFAEFVEPDRKKRAWFESLCRPLAVTACAAQMCQNRTGSEAARCRTNRLLFRQPGHAQALDQGGEVGRLPERLDDAYLSQPEISAKSQQLRDESAGLVHQTEMGMGGSEIEANP